VDWSPPSRCNFVSVLLIVNFGIDPIKYRARAIKSKRGNDIEIIYSLETVLHLSADVLAMVVFSVGYAKLFAAIYFFLRALCYMLYVNFISTLNSHIMLYEICGATMGWT
jgi:hypothetical protein